MSYISPKPLVLPIFPRSSSVSHYLHHSTPHECPEFPPHSPVSSAAEEAFPRLTVAPCRTLSDRVSPSYPHSFFVLSSPLHSHFRFLAHSVRPMLYFKGLTPNQLISNLYFLPLISCLFQNTTGFLPHIRSRLAYFLAFFLLTIYQF